jgi:RND family efflux transporter MFP subunit
MLRAVGSVVSVAPDPKARHRPIPYRRLWPLALLLSLALAGCESQSAETKPKSDRPVLVATVHYEPLVPERSFVASIRPRVESDLGFRVTGKVVRRLVDVGQQVTTGQLLAILDDTDLKLQVDQAEAEQRAATTALAQATADERRGNELLKRGWSADATFDRQKAAAEEARGRMTRAERALELARNNLSYATLTAGSTGVVTATMVEPGQVVAAGQAAIRLARLDEKEAVVAVPESLVERVRTGTATLSLWSQANSHYAAHLRELAPAADPATRTYLARFSLPDAGPEVALGMTATLTLADPAREQVARLPLSALFNQGTGPALWVVDDKGDLALKPVTVTAYEGRDVLIAGGVGEGQRVVALGVQKLDPTEKVKIVQALAF